MRRTLTLLAAASVLATALYGLSAAPALAAPPASCTDPNPTSVTAAELHGYHNGCKLGAMKNSDQCSVWLYSTKYKTYSTAAKDFWKGGCSNGVAAGTSVLTTNLGSKSVSSIASDCTANTPPGVDQPSFVEGCKIGHYGQLNGYPQTDTNTEDEPFEFVCGFAGSNHAAAKGPGWDQGCAFGFTYSASHPPTYPSTGGSTVSGGGTGGTVSGGGTGGTVSGGGTGTGGGTVSGGGTLPSTTQDVIKVINRITNWFFTIFLLVAVIMIIYAAFLYLTSGGGEEVGKAHKMLLYAAVAIAIASLAKGIVVVIQRLVRG